VKSILYRALLLALPLLLLSHCGREQADEQEQEIPVFTSATAGIEWSSQIMRFGYDLAHMRPSGLLGVFVSHYLVHTSTFRSAIAGVESVKRLIGQEEYEQSEDFALLQDIGTIRQVDVEDMLNRSNDRAGAFDVYVGSLTDLLKLGAVRLARLEQEMEIISDERRAKRRAASDVQHDLNTALRDQNYAVASELQQRLINAEADLARVETEQDQKQSIIGLYEDLLDIGDKRLLAMRENREVLIAGLKVIDVPGIDDLGILEEANRRELREEKGQYDYLFEGLGE